ncbi:hypothetical protein C0J52_13370 [Blattella germanica]|nr:hypothetical protein C0J52_13370 [Blattella germanica]
MVGRRRSTNNSKTSTGSRKSRKSKSSEMELTHLEQIIRLEDFEIQFKNKLALLDSILKKRIASIEWEYKVALKKIPPEILHNKIQWSNTQNGQSSGRNDTQFIRDLSTSKLPSMNSSSISSISTLTTSSNVSQQSSLDTKMEKSKQTSAIMRGKYKTPGCNSGFSSVPDLITPKVLGNGPICMARYPLDGEMAVSLSGSPLMVTPLIQHYRANTNIMLSDGKVMSILPEHGLRPNDIPILDEETRNELLTLKENISAFINLTNDKI